MPVSALRADSSVVAEVRPSPNHNERRGSGVADMILLHYTGVPDNQSAIVGLALANMDKGDVQAAERTLTQAAAAPLSSREIFYNLAEIKVAKNQTDEAIRLYQKAADADTSWGKPLYKLATIAMSKGDKQAALKAMTQVIAVDPTSPEAAQAKSAVEQLR